MSIPSDGSACHITRIGRVECESGSDWKLFAVSAHGDGRHGETTTRRGGFGFDIAGPPEPVRRNCIAASRNTSYYELALVHPTVRTRDRRSIEVTAPT